MKPLRTKVFAVLTLAAASACGVATEEDADATDSAIVQERVAELTDAERTELVHKKATCPFVGAAVAMKRIAVRFGKANPLAKIDEIVALGNEGGGDLGKVLHVFASGNHRRMFASEQPAAGEPFTTPTPPGMFSLDLPRSQGAHPGHSGILVGGHEGAYFGTFDGTRLSRFLAYGVDERGRRAGDPGFSQAKYIKRSDIGKFIWHNVENDGESVHLTQGFGVEVLRDSAALLTNPSIETVVAMTATNHVVGSAGEFALMMTILELPNEVDGEPAIAIADVKTMFEDKRLPAGWNARPRTAVRWMHHTAAITAAAVHERF